MNRILLAAGVASAALVTAGLTAPAALASGTDATCTSTLQPGTYQNVTVPAQATCTLTGSDIIITGNVTVATGASLSDINAPIGGNLQADHAGTVFVSSASVGGNVQLTATSGANTLCSVPVGKDLVIQNSAASSSLIIFPCNFSPVTVGGSLTVQNNAGKVSVEFSTVAGNISVHNNTGGGDLGNNSAGGSCQLFNDNPPITGSGNSVPPGHQNTCNGSA
jgi:hypothetical protein